MEEIRLLTREDIECRVAQTTCYNDVVKVSLLLYKNARVDMKILDEIYTPMGWKRTHRLIGDRLYCEVSVWDDTKKEWVSKEDVGVESNTEAEKGQASDSFKRACFNWGIGRELYTAPKIVIPLRQGEYGDNNGKIRVWATFSVGSITYTDRVITGLEIVDKSGEVRYTMGSGVQVRPSNAVKARRTAAAKEIDNNEPYKPLSENDYWKIVKAYAEGKTTKTGGDYRSAWIDKTGAGFKEIQKFESDVQNFINAK